MPRPSAGASASWNQRREQAVTEHREAAEARSGRADEAEHRARLATARAERERAEARLHEESARAHEMGSPMTS